MTATKGTLLVIENDVDTRDLLVRWLRPHHYVVHATSVGEQTAALIHQLEPDLMLIGGTSAACIELYDYVKNHDELGFLPIIALLDTTSESLIGRADDFVHKPVRQEEILPRVNILLRFKYQYDTLRQRNQALEVELKKRNAELEKALHESRGLAILKDSIISNVSHELKTPLLQVKSAVSLMAEDSRKTNKHGNSPLADMATQATAKLESVVLNITQLAATFNVKSEPFRLVDAINIAIRQLGRQWASSAAVDRISIAVDGMPFVWGDRGGVAQVLQQLIDNALKFSPSGGPIEISAEDLGGGVWIAVRDYGIGIRADQLEQIFQAFYQADNSTTRPFGGTGVGLAIVKLILDAMNTTIDVQSTPGVGSCFSFTLPVAELNTVETMPGANGI